MEYCKNMEKKRTKVEKIEGAGIFKEGFKSLHWKVGKILRTARGKDDIIRGPAGLVFNEKTRGRTISAPLQKFEIKAGERR